MPPVVIAAGVAAAGTLGAAAISKSGSRSSSGSSGSNNSGNQLLEEGAGLRQASIEQALRAILEGVEPVSTLPITQRNRSAIEREGGRRRARTEEALARQGLKDSAYGIQELDDIDRDIASLLVDADIEQLRELIRFGREAGWKGVAPGTQSQIAQNEIAATERMNKQKMLLGVGQSVGRAIGGMSFSSGSSSPSANTVSSTSPSFGVDAPTMLIG